MQARLGNPPFSSIAEFAVTAVVSYEFIIFSVGILEGIVLQCFSKKFRFAWGYVPVVVLDSILDWSVRKLLRGGVWTLLIVFSYPFRIQSLEMDHWYLWGILFCLVDFLFYWMHRSAHRIPVLWAYHSVHHVPNRLSILGGHLNGINRSISGLTIFFSPLVWLGFPPAAVIKTVLFVMAYNSLMHSEWFPKLGIVDRILVTPSNHRVHHAVNEEYLNCNYGGVTLLWDHIFSTFKAAGSDAKLTFGLLEPELSYNPFRIFFRGYIDLLGRLKGCRSLSQILRVLFVVDQPANARNPSKSV